LAGNVVQVIFSWWDALFCFQLLDRMMMQPEIPGVHEETEVFVLHSGLLGSLGQLVVAFTDFEAHLEPPLLLFSELVQFVSTGRDCKIELSRCNLCLSWIAVLPDEIAGQAREVVVFDLLDGALASGDRFTGGSLVMVDD